MPNDTPRTVTRAELAALAEQERADAYRAARRWPRGDLEALARSFPTLRDVPARFFETREDHSIGFTFGEGAIAFATWARTQGGGGRDAALFVLSVWNPADDWRELAGLARDDGPTGGRFDVHRALGNWDPAHRAAFLRWAEDPWWL